MEIGLIKKYFRKPHVFYLDKVHNGYTTHLEMLHATMSHSISRKHARDPNTSTMMSGGLKVFFSPINIISSLYYESQDPLVKI